MRFLWALLLTVAIVSCGKPSDDEELEDLEGIAAVNPYPRIQGSSDVRGEKNFATLINNNLQGKVEPTPWVGYWWPFTANGIAAGGSGGSPAGKYDAARGGRTHAQSWEAQFHGSKLRGIQGWWGHCNGWCAAAALFPEPKEPVVVNGIRFDVADLKALLTEVGMSASADFFGSRVDYGNDYNTPKMTDTVPDQYFLVLTNYVGRLKQAVLIDRFTAEQVWNQPVAGYRFEYPKREDYLGADPAAPNVYRILLTGTLWWGRDDVAPGVITSPFNFEENEHYQERTLKMEIWLDGPVVFGSDGKIASSGNVIVTRQGDYHVGGAWRMGDGYFADGWPDYMWIPYSLVKPDPTSDDDFANIDIDADWLKKHLLVPGGMDDNSASPRPVEPAPNPSTSPIPLPSGAPTTVPLPTPTRTVTPTGVPTVTPTVTPTVVPTVVPTVTPTPTPTPSRPRPSRR